MGRSQRHMIQEQNTTSAGEVHAQGVVADSVYAQVDPENIAVLVMPKVVSPEGGFQVPEGPAGGPLQGSTMSGAIPESIGPAPGPDPGPDPEPGLEPIVDSIDPTFVVIGEPDFTLHVHGQNFTDTSVINFNGGDETTTFVSDTELTTIVKPSLAEAPVEVPVQVRQGSYRSNAVNFNFEEARAEESDRLAGPFNIVLVEDHLEGLAVTLDGGEYKVGDDVMVEATGNTSVNGDYEILQVDGLTIVIDSAYALDAPIEAKGRLTITGAVP